FLTILAIGYLVQERKTGWWLATIPIYLVALVLTTSRGSWIGFAVSVVLFISFLTFRKMREMRSIRWALVTVLAIVTVASLFVASSPSLRDRFVSSFSLERNADRLLIWQAAIEMIKDRPLTGVG